MLSLVILAFIFFWYAVLQYFLYWALYKYKFTGVNYLFDPDQLHNIAKKAATLEGKSADKFNYIIEELSKTHPNHIWKKKEWHWFNAGGWMGNICFLHASLSEYVKRNDSYFEFISFISFDSSFSLDRHFQRADILDGIHSKFMTLYLMESIRRKKKGR